MNPESIARILIYLHAGFGGIALFTGAVALSARKGNPVHKKWGKVFYYTMLTAAFSALVIAVLPGHESPFLFAIGVFSSYFVISGFRSLRFREPAFDTRPDRLIGYGIILTGLTMILYPALLYGKLNPVLAVFGTVGISFGLRDLRIAGNLEKRRQLWQTLHLGKMVGGYIAATTAFLVVNQILPGLWSWFTPGVVGGAYIAWWTRRLKRE